MLARFQISNLKFEIRSASASLAGFLKTSPFAAKDSLIGENVRFYYSPDRLLARSPSIQYSSGMSSGRNIGLVITPGGQLRIEEAPDSLPEVSAAEAETLEKAFGKSNAAGLLLLASQEMQLELPASLAFWRGLACQFFQAVCQLGEGGFGHWGTVADPAAEHLEQLVADFRPCWPGVSQRRLAADRLERIGRAGAAEAQNRPRGRRRICEGSIRCGICWGG